MKKYFLLLSLFAISPGWAQKFLNQPNVYFEHIFLPGSIRFNPIRDIAQDDEGLLWMTSDNGVYRYDGYEFTSGNEFADFQVVKEFQANSVVAGENNSIYVSFTRKNGLIKFKSDFSGFQLYQEEIQDYTIHELFMLKNKLGFLSKGRGLFFFDEEKKEVEAFEYQYPVSSISQKNDTIIAGSYGSIIIYVASKPLRKIELPQIQDNIHNIDLENNIVYFSTTDEVFSIDLNNENLKPLILSKQINSKVSGIHFSKNKQLWVLTEDNGVFMCDKGGDLLHFEKNYYQKGSLSNNKAINIFESTDGVLWITTGAGINKYDKSKRYFSHLYHDPLNKNTLSGDIVRGIFENSEEKLLVATDDGVINVIDSSRRSLDPIPFDFDNNKRIIPFDFLEEDKDNYLVGTSHGLYHLNLPSKKLSFLVKPPRPSDGRVRQMIRYTNDEILGLSTGTLWNYNITTGDIKTYSNIKGDNNRILTKRARILYKDNDDLYIGGIGEVAKFNPQTLQYKSRAIATISEKGDTIKHMVMYLKRYDDKLIIGTFKGGLYILDLAVPDLKGKLSWYGQENGLPDNTIYAAIKDDFGNFWISTNNGISRYNPETETFLNYDRSNGLQGEEFNRLAYETTQRGEFIFGGIEGLNIFYPKEAYENNILNINPILLHVEVINHYDTQGRKHPQYNLINVDKINLSYDQNYLTFKFSSDNFSEPEKNKFYYKLDNYDNKWIYTNERSATYTGLAPGNYTFKIKAVNTDGSLSKNEASASIVITTTWWRTWWAGVILFFLIVAIVIYSIRKNIHKTRAIKEFLEREIDRRTRELKESKEELARLNSKKDFIFSILSHDLRSPLTTLKGFLGILIDHFDTLDEKDIKTHAINIKNSVAKSLDLLDNTLFWSLSQMGEITYTPTKVSLNNIFDKLHGLYDLTAKKKNIAMHIDIEPEIELFVDENMAYITIRNLVSNALKFTPGGKRIFVRAKKVGHNAHITIQDEGRGIKADDLSKLFDQNQHYMEKGTSNEKGTGLGLILCKKFTDMNHGKITVESKENTGSIFTVILPLYEEEIIERFSLA